LTRRYIAGERARFISPVALYLFSVFLMFAVLNFTGALDGEKGSVAKSNLQIAVDGQNETIAKLEKRRAAAAAAHKTVAQRGHKIASEKEDLAQLEKVQRGELTVEGDAQRNSPEWIRNALERVQQNPELV